MTKLSDEQVEAIFCEDQAAEALDSNGAGTEQDAADEGPVEEGPVDEEIDPWDFYARDRNLETRGIPYQIGPWTFMVARAGGSNTAYTRAEEKALRPFRESRVAILTNQNAGKIVHPLYAQHVVRGWSSDRHGPGFIWDADGKPLKFSRQNCVRLFGQMPELFMDVYRCANTPSHYRPVAEENDEGN